MSRSKNKLVFLQEELFDEGTVAVFVSSFLTSSAAFSPLLLLTTLLSAKVFGGVFTLGIFLVSPSFLAASAAVVADDVDDGVGISELFSIVLTELFETVVGLVVIGFVTVVGFVWVSCNG